MTQQPMRFHSTPGYTPWRTGEFLTHIGICNMCYKECPRERYICEKCHDGVKCILCDKAVHDVQHIFCDDHLLMDRDQTRQTFDWVREKLGIPQPPIELLRKPNKTKMLIEVMRSIQEGAELLKELKDILTDTKLLPDPRFDMIADELDELKNDIKRLKTEKQN